jgi:hypothetical protein
MRQIWQRWQEYEGGPLVAPRGAHPFYNLARFGWKQKRLACLQKYPICTMCLRKPSQVVDHLKPFITPEGIVSWALFADPANHVAKCRSCDSTLTAKYDGGFGNKRKAGKESHCQPTGESGKQFSSSSVPTAALDRALTFDVADLLAGVPQ